MSNASTVDRGGCPAPFFSDAPFGQDGGFVTGRLCQPFGDFKCCLPCPMTEWVYPDNFNTLSATADWITVVGTVCCAFLLISWAVLPVEKTARHYLSISLTCAVILMNLGFLVPLAAKPQQCFDAITPHSMESSPVCGASGAFLLIGGFAGVMWVFLRSLSLHLQICWQVVVGRPFMWAAQAAGWGVPVIAVVIALIFSGVSFRFGNTCHINHKNSLADFWIPLLIFAGLTVIIQFATFGYCIKVYLASLADNSATTEGSELPSYTNSIRTLSPRQAYRRVRRVIQLQWKGIAIVLIIIADVIFFSIVFVFQDNTLEAVQKDASLALPWAACLITKGGDKNACLKDASKLVIPEATVMAVLILLACNGIWLLFLLGRISMLTAWVDLARSLTGGSKREFVSVDARTEIKKDTRAYEMLSRDSGKTDSVMVTPLSPPVKTPMSPMNGRRTPDYFAQASAAGGGVSSDGSSAPIAARYQVPARSFSSPRPPPQTWDSKQPYARPANGGDDVPPYGGAYGGAYAGVVVYGDMNPLGMNKI